MNKPNKYIDGECLEGIAEIRKIGLTPKEKRAIFHSILSLSKVMVNEEEEKPDFRI